MSRQTTQSGSLWRRWLAWPRAWLAACSSSATLAALLDSDSEAVLLVNPDKGLIEHANPAAAALLECTPEALQQRSLSEFCEIDLRSERPAPCRLEMRAVGGAQVTVELRQSSVPCRRGRLLVLRLRHSALAGRARAILQALADVPSEADPAAFFQHGTQLLAETFGSRYALVSRYTDASHSHLRTLAFWNGEGFLEPFEYAVADTPCERCLQVGAEVVERGVQQRYPQDQDLVTLGIESYIGAALRTAEGEALGVLNVFHDAPLSVSEEDRSLISLFAQRFSVELQRQHIQRELRGSEQRYRDVIDCSLQGMIVHCNGRNLFANPALADIFGYDNPAELIAEEDFFRLFPDYERDRLRRLAQARLRGEAVPSHYELDGLRRDGRIITLLNTARCIEWKGEPAVLSVMLDITERKIAERALRDSEARFRDFAEVAADWFWEQDEQLRFIYLSANHSRVTGLPSSRFIGRTRWEAFSGTPADPHRWQQHIEDVKAHKPFVLEYTIERGNGQLLHIYNTGKPIYDQAGHFRGYRGVGRDVTAQHRLEDTLRRQQDDLQHLLTQRSEELEVAQRELVKRERLATIGCLAATVSHELRNPLATMRNAVFYLRRKAIKAAEDTGQPAVGDDKCLQYLEIIDAEITQADKIIADLLETTRPKNPRWQAFALDKLLDELLERDILSPTITLSFVGPRPCMVTADRGQMQQVLVNLLMNAAQAMGDSGFVQIEWRGEAQVDWLRISDDGPGVASDDRARIFEPMFSTRSKGNGLGLWISREIIQRHGGDIVLEEDGGTGASFLIRLPRRQDLMTSVA